MAALIGGPPTERGGWWHEYVCPAHGVELEHSPYSDEGFPAEGAACRYGCRVDTEAVRGAWRVLAHQAWARRIRVLAHAGDSEAVTRLADYAELYAMLTKKGEHEQAQGWMLRGRMFHQALTDAVWATQIGHAVWTLAETGHPGLEPVLPMLNEIESSALSARQTLIDQGKFESNYTAWLNAAGLVASRAAAIVRGEKPADRWLGDAHGVFAHMAVATGADGWEWEASTYYHGFVLRAYLLSLRGQDPSDVPEQLATMITALAGIATDGGVLPALHDGPYQRTPLALEWLEIGALAAQFTDAHGLDAVMDQARAEVGAGYDGLEDHLGGWFAGPPRPGRLGAPAPVRVFADAGYAVVRARGIHALLDFGPHGGSHGHHDKLALYFYGTTTAWQPDPGQVPYGHRQWRRYYSSAAAHPTIRVDGGEPREATGQLVAHGSASVTTAIDGWYDGVTATRHVEAGDGYLVDLVRVHADRPREIVLQLRPAVDFSIQIGHSWFRTAWTGTDELHGWHLSDIPANPLARPIPGTADDPQQTRTGLDWTLDNGTAITFGSVYEVGPLTIRSVRMDDGALTVELADGTVRTHHIGG